ncbi:MAG: hypothetical protein HOP12_03875 [Candidatus Eisenbacteria bacterium]|uniref:Uncharacterized protein n=1 Tax=Eiseniibacteriota bacterium TaxID=2212470 RepID=A0A849SPH1_UNCEI|nr:hypothetical protein [Candidatus Eisenbacteria bacterium]
MNLRPVMAALVLAAICSSSSTNSQACDKNKTTATAASASAKSASCAAHQGATITTASTASADGGACCAGGTKMSTASAKGKMAAGGSCSMSKGAMASHDCDACEDLALCGPGGNDATSAVQAVALKNGVMFVYTANGPGGVNALQANMQRRSERLGKLVSAGDKAKLCDECKVLRGAMASGKLSREVVNIEGGTLVLMTSSDPVLVKKIRTMAEGTRTAAQVKS